MAGKKRGPGEGSITKRADGRYMVRLPREVGPDGKVRRPTFYAKTFKEAQRLKLEGLHRQRQGLLPTAGSETVAQYLDEWLEGKHDIAESTRRRYGLLIKYQIAPHLGKVKLAKLASADLDRLYRRLRASGSAPQTVRKVHALLNAALKKAMRRGLILRNPAELVDAPRVPRCEVEPLDKAEIRRLLAAANGDRFAALYLLAIASGMRLGELLGLKWSDIDLASRVLTVKRQAQPEKGMGLVLRELKTGHSRRAIRLPRAVVAALQSHRERQAEARLLAGPRWCDLDLVFPNGIGKPLRRNHVTERAFKPLLARAGMRDIRFHDLRHSAATLLMVLGINPKQVQERLGHADIGTTMDTYTHMMPEMQEQVAEALDRFLDGDGA